MWPSHPGKSRWSPGPTEWKQDQLQSGDQPPPLQDRRNRLPSSGCRTTLPEVPESLPVRRWSRWAVIQVAWRLGHSARSCANALASRSRSLWSCRPFGLALPQHFGPPTKMHLWSGATGGGHPTPSTLICGRTASIPPACRNPWSRPASRPRSCARPRDFGAPAGWGVFHAGPYGSHSSCTVAREGCEPGGQRPFQCRRAQKLRSWCWVAGCGLGPNCRSLYSVACSRFWLM